MAFYLGLDLGTHCGWSGLTVAPDRGFLLVSGVWDCSVKTGHDSPSLRFEKFSKRLDDLLAVGPDRVFYELVRAHKGVQAGHIYGGFLAKLQERCDVYGIPYEGLSVQEIKKFTTGKGNASKARMIEAVRAWGFSPGCDNEADAIGIVRCGWETKT